MNGGPPVGVWREAKAADGRTYYYNDTTKQTQWTKPDALMTPQERALANQPWKEFTTPDGRKYWNNSVTKESVWDIPKEYKDALELNVPPPRPAAPAFVAGGGSDFPPFRPQIRDREEHSLPDRPVNDRPSYHGANEGFRGPSFVPQSEPDYSSQEEAEAAFMKLLRRAGVEADWTWEETMKATITDPQYRSIKDSKDRKAAFEKFVTDLRAQEKDKEKDRQAKLRSDFTRMLRSHPEIKYYTRWKTARSIIEAETIFRSAKSEDERLSLFNEYRNELYKAHVENEASSRRSAMDELGSILASLDLEPYTRWSEAQGIIQENERFSGDEKFKSLTKSDVLRAFEAHIKSLERSFNDARQKQKLQKTRQERQNRDSFIQLLKDLQSAGKIRAGTKWMQILPLIEEDPRYVAILGQPGSTPLELFWDIVEEEERVLRSKRNDALDVLEDKRFEITLKTTFEEFLSVMQTDRRTARVDNESMSLIFERLRDKISRRNEEDKHQAERHQRRAVDALRSKLKHLEPPIELGDTWEQVCPRIEKLEEYRALDSDELRRSAFEKHMRRLKEKEEDYERDRARRDHRDRERDRDRDGRNGHSRHRRTRSPEPDAYEADRKKAQADRERQYRKASTTGMSPRRDWDERDRYDRGSSRHVSSSHYDRERREREVERERSYVSRADPRDKGNVELDYGGDSRPASTRRRRDSDADSPDSRRDSKRLRRDRDSREPTYSPRRHRTRTPQPPAEPQEDPAVRSGSEEGEIEEV